MLLRGIQPVDNFEGTFSETDCDCDRNVTTFESSDILAAIRLGVRINLTETVD